jgi:hypothetical protein
MNVGSQADSILNHMGPCINIRDDVSSLQSSLFGTPGNGALTVGSNHNIAECRLAIPCGVGKVVWLYTLGWHRHRQIFGSRYGLLQF